MSVYMGHDATGFDHMLKVQVDAGAYKNDTTADTGATKYRLRRGQNAISPEESIRSRIAPKMSLEQPYGGRVKRNRQIMMKRDAKDAPPQLEGRRRAHHTRDIGIGR